MLLVSNIDRAVAPLYDAPSGFRKFGVQDPDGHDIAFALKL